MRDRIGHVSQRAGKQNPAVAKAFLFSLLALAVPAEARAQDAHYWTYQYGTRANLLSGAVVGSVVDLSAAYYNPGALALIDDPDLIATSKVVELSAVSIDPELGIEVDLNDLRFDFAPGFIAGLLPFGFLGDNLLVYSIFTRQLYKTNINAARSSSSEQLTDSLLPEGEFFGEFRLNRDLSETWVGLSFSAPIGRLGIGVSQYVAYRSQKGLDKIFVEVVGTGSGALSLTQDEFSFHNYRLLWKVGVTFEWLGASLGAAITTPSVSVLGSGKVLVNRTELGPDTVFVASFQDGLGATYKSPLSLSFGGAYKRESTTLHLTAEYFAQQDSFTIMEPEPFVGQSTGDTVNIILTEALDDVLNFTAGVERRFKPTLAGYLSFRTDFSAKVQGSASDVSTSLWNLYFITAGTAFRIGTANLTLGLTYGFGGRKDVDLRKENLLDAGGSSPVPGKGTIKYRSLRLIVALAL